MHRWASGFRSPLAISSGNHDANDPEILPTTRELPRVAAADRHLAESLILRERWMEALSRPGVVTDNRSEVLETASGRIVITTIPYDYTGCTHRKDLWRSGASLRKQTAAPWLVLHHEPPADTDVGGLHGNTGLPFTLKPLSLRVTRSLSKFVVKIELKFMPMIGTYPPAIGACARGTKRLVISLRKASGD